MIDSACRTGLKVSRGTAELPGTEVKGCNVGMTQRPLKESPMAKGQNKRKNVKKPKQSKATKAAKGTKGKK